MTPLEALERIRSHNYHEHSKRECLGIIEKSLKALEIIKDNVGLKISVDNDMGCLYVPIVKCFQPLEQSIVIVGYVQGKDKVDLIKEILQ